MVFTGCLTWWKSRHWIRPPSDLGIIGRYVLTPAVFAALAQTPPGTGGEIQLTDGLKRLLADQPIYAVETTGVRYNTGHPLGWLKAQFSFALKHPEYGPVLRKYIKTIWPQIDS